MGTSYSYRRRSRVTSCIAVVETPVAQSAAYIAAATTVEPHEISQALR